MALVQLDEYMSKKLLESNGLSVPCRSLIEDGLDGVDPPFAIKAVGTAIKHKTELGGVVLDVASREKAMAEAEAMASRIPDADIMVEEMAPKGVEAIVGVAQDPTFGLVIMVGIGGTMAELVNDAVFRKIPIDLGDATEMLNDLKHADLFRGYRGGPEVARDLASMLVSISQLAIDERIVDMDLNPVILGEDGPVIADAKITLERDG